MRLKPHRALLVVASMARALGFYRNVLGLEFVSDAVRSGDCYDEITGIKSVKVRVCFLKLEGDPFQIELVQYLRPPSPKRTWATSDLGATRLCFSVGSITTALKGLKAAKVRCLRGPILLEKDGRSVAFLLLLRDPDGYQIELRAPLL